MNANHFTKMKQNFLGFSFALNPINKKTLNKLIIKISQFQIFFE